MLEKLILVDEEDNETGVMDKMAAHQTGALHRAFSIFIFNTNNQLLLQQRADQKYHSPGLWTNTCCSHPRKGEDVAITMRNRLLDEMGMQCELDFKFSFVYRSEFNNGLIEHEFDHVYFGFTDQTPEPNSLEVKNWKYIFLPDLEAELRKSPQNYSAWLKIAMPQVLHHLTN